MVLRCAGLLGERGVGVAAAGRVVEPPLQADGAGLLVAEQRSLTHHHDVDLGRGEHLRAARHHDGDARLRQHRGPLHRRLGLLSRSDGGEARVLVAVDLHLRVEGDEAVGLGAVGQRAGQQELAQLAQPDQPVLLDE
eukprot:scaffold108784_cov63-Phaeocystis_antarctica.AAC.1